MPGDAGGSGGESAAGSRDQKLGLAVEKLKARLIFPGCPGADVAVSHRILLGKVWGPKTFIGAAAQGTGGPRDGSPVGPAVPSPFPCGSRAVIAQGHICGAGGTLPIASNPHVPA